MMMTPHNLINVGLLYVDQNFFWSTWYMIKMINLLSNNIIFIQSFGLCAVVQCSGLCTGSTKQKEITALSLFYGTSHANPPVVLPQTSVLDSTLSHTCLTLHGWWICKITEVKSILKTFHLNHFQPIRPVGAYNREKKRARFCRDEGEKLLHRRQLALLVPKKSEWPV